MATKKLDKDKVQAAKEQEQELPVVPLDLVADRLRAKINQLNGETDTTPFAKMAEDDKDFYRSCVKAMVADHDSMRLLFKSRGMTLS